MFENKKFEGIYYTRFIASWTHVGGTLKYSEDFKEWLRTLCINGKYMPEDVIKEIVYLATCGKSELEDHAYRFIKG